MARYGQARPVWAQDLAFVLGAGVVAYGTAQWARRYGKPTVPALVATGAGVAALVARNYVDDDLFGSAADGAAGAGIAYGWMFAAANTLGKGAIPLMTASSQARAGQIRVPRPPAAAPARGRPVTPIGSRRGGSRGAAVGKRGLALGA